MIFGLFRAFFRSGGRPSASGDTLAVTAMHEQLDAGY
jgi:hypothetical protein